MGADAFFDVSSSFDDYERIAAQYRNCVVRCRQAAEQLRACESELRRLACPQDACQDSAEFTEDLGIDVGALATRELEVFTLVGLGLTTQRIAERLSRGTSTVETYRERIKHKLKLSSGSELTRQAVLWVESQKQQCEQAQSRRE
jgi:DNA-binding NarL/FixJ family response regulator